MYINPRVFPVPSGDVGYSVDRVSTIRYYMTYLPSHLSHWFIRSVGSFTGLWTSETEGGGERHSPVTTTIVTTVVVPEGEGEEEGADGRS